MRAAKPMAAGWTAVLALGIAGVAHAQTNASSWSVDSGETVGSGQNVLRGQLGYPGLWGDFIHGIDPTTEIGGRMKLNYGVEGIVDNTHFEWAVQFLARKQFVDTGKIKFALRFDPGFLLTPAGGTTTFGILFPLEAQLGFPISDVVIINGSFAVPMYATFGDFGAFFVPLMFGGGVEYKIQSNLDLTFKLAMGPTIGTKGGTHFTLNALFGLAWRM